MRSLIRYLLLAIYVVHSILFFYVNLGPQCFECISGKLFSPVIAFVPSPLYLTTLISIYTVIPLAGSEYLATNIMFALSLLIPALFLFIGFYRKSKYALYAFMFACLIQTFITLFYYLQYPSEMLVPLILVEFLVSLVYFSLLLYIKKEFS